MEITKVSDEIQERIRLLGICRKELQTRAEEAAKTKSEYESELSKTIVQLAVNGEHKDVQDQGATNREKIARGLCSDELYKMELASSRYKNAVKGMETLMAEMNGLQSIFRHLEQVGK